MDITSIEAARQSFVVLLGLTKAAAGAVVDHGVKEKLIEIQQGILDAQARLGDAQADRLNLLEQVAELKARLRSIDAAQARLDAYELFSLDAGKWVYKPRAEGDDHFACPACYSKGTIGVLQGTKTGSAQMHWKCSLCESFSMYVGPSDVRVRAAGVVSSHHRDW